MSRRLVTKTKVVEQPVVQTSGRRKAAAAATPAPVEKKKTLPKRKTRSSKVKPEEEEVEEEEVAMHDDEELETSKKEEEAEHVKDEEEEIDMDIDLDALVSEASEKFVELSSKDQESAADSRALSFKRALGLDRDSLGLEDLEGITSIKRKEENPRSVPSTSFLSARAIRSTLHDREQELEHKALYVAKSTGDLPQPFKKEPKKRDTAGKGWFDLPAQKITPELKNELALLGMKNLLDKKHYFRKEKGDVIPKYFHIGTEVGSKEDMWSGFGKRVRSGKSITDAILEDYDTKASIRQRFNRYVDARVSRKRAKKSI